MNIKKVRLWKKIALGTVAGAFIIIVTPAAAKADGAYTCESNGIPYASLSEAVEAVGENGTATITMTADETLTNHIVLGKNQNITLDLAGFHIDYPDSNDYNAVEIDSGCLTLNDSVGTGTISSGNDYYGMIMVGGGEFIMNGGNIVENDNPGTNETGIYANHGKVTINGGTVNARFPFQLYGKMGDGLELTINGGTFQGQLNAALGGDVRGTINGGSFSVSADDEALMIWLREYTSGVPQVKIQGGEYHGSAAGISIYNTDYYEGYTYGLKDILGDGYVWSDYTETNPEPNVVYSAKDVTVYPVLSESNVTIKGLEDVTCTGKEIEPELAITYQGRTLEEGRDYDVQYANNLNPGTAEVTITFNIPYAGVIHTSFQIVERPAETDDYQTVQQDATIKAEAEAVPADSSDNANTDPGEAVSGLSDNAATTDSAVRSDKASPKTGDNTMVGAFLILVSASGVGLSYGVIWYKSQFKKKKKL